MVLPNSVRGGARSACLLLLVSCTTLRAETVPLQAGATVGPPPRAAIQVLRAASTPNTQMAPATASGMATARSLAGATTAPAPAVRGQGAELAYTLTARYRYGSLYNPESGGRDAVYLRSYDGQVNTAGGIVDTATERRAPMAPMLEIAPGERLRLTLVNDLPANDVSCGAHMHEHANVPHCFNSTNNHVHGLWVSPSGASDNVFVNVKPKQSFEHVYDVPAEHPAGTFWYHPHLHGSTALQVSSGMAAPLIIRGDRTPQWLGDRWRWGDIDPLVALAAGPSSTAERVLMLQQISYACRTAVGGIKTNLLGHWQCAPAPASLPARFDPNDPAQRGLLESVGTLENYDQFTKVGPLSWLLSGRHTSINGEVHPRLASARAGKLERWRLLHGGVTDSIKVTIRAVDPVQEQWFAERSGQPAGEAELDRICSGPPVEFLSIATDGLNRPRMRRGTATVMHPGYREDLLVVFPKPGRYCVYDGAMPALLVANVQEHRRRLLGYVDVEGPAAVAHALPGREAGDALAQLAAAARQLYQGETARRIEADLLAGRLDAFVKHRPVRNAEVAGQPLQTLGFKILPVPGQREPEFMISELASVPFTPLLLPVNAASYLHSRIDRTAKLGTAQEWLLASFVGNHPFHIHVNPFEVVEVLDPLGRDVSALDDPSADNPYAGMKGTWRDTLLVQQGFRIRIRTRYERFAGDFVLHCHILDHEDMGMMQNVRIVPAN